MQRHVICRKVTNLADGVTNDDIKELFESVGLVKFAEIEWDHRSAAFQS